MTTFFTSITLFIFSSNVDAFALLTFFCLLRIARSGLYKLLAVFLFVSCGWFYFIRGLPLNSSIVITGVMLFAALLLIATLYSLRHTKEKLKALDSYELGLAYFGTAAICMIINFATVTAFSTLALSNLVLLFMLHRSAAKITNDSCDLLLSLNFTALLFVAVSPTQPSVITFVFIAAAFCIYKLFIGNSDLIKNLQSAFANRKL